jgi:hypothetical protein
MMYKIYEMTSDVESDDEASLNVTALPPPNGLVNSLISDDEANEEKAAHSDSSQFLATSACVSSAPARKNKRKIMKRVNSRFWNDNGMYETYIFFCQ